MKSAPLLIAAISLQTFVLHAQGTPSGSLPSQASTDLAELMCRQLPNVAALPAKGNLIGDDVHDSLVTLGKYSLPCLIDHLADEVWMPDPRQEPLTGDFRAGDAAFFTLADKGVDFSFVWPMLDEKEYEAVGIYAYFSWVNKANHRAMVQQHTHQWVSTHPNCCNGDSSPPANPGHGPRFQLGPEKVSELRHRMSRVWPGMDERAARNILGMPDFEVDGLDEAIDSIIDLNREEKSALVYWVKRWSNGSGGDEFRQRDFLRDKYVIVYFTTQAKLGRIFSNTPQIPAMYPRTRQLWMTLMWGKEAANQ